MSTNGKEYKLAIRIAGIIDKSFTTSLTAANSSLKATLLSVDKDFSMLDKGFNKVAKLGQRCFSTIATAAGVATVAIGAATAASIAVGSEFESAFAGVKKTVDATEKEFERLRQDILDMSRVIPSSASDIAGVMEIAGQLGIANEYLTDFTETMINLGVSTNMTAEDAATALAKFANITGMDPNDYERLGSVIVDLGNNFATTEEDIVHMATRLASTGDLVGLSEAQIMALSTAMSAVGIKAESGGSTMSKLLKKMQLAVELNTGALEEYASVADMTGAEFSEAFKEDAVVALSAFIDGLKDTERNGKSAIAILDDMGLKEVRLSNTILALAGSENVMTEAITMANEAWEENTALAIEAGRRYETAESKMIILGNSLKELGIVAYEDLREPFVDGIESITEKVHDLTDYVDGPNGMGAWIESIGTELPTLQRKFKKYGEPVLEGITGSGKWIVKNGKGIISVLSGVGAAMASYKVASSGVHFITALTKLGPAAWGILGVVAAIGALTTAVVAYKQHEHDLANSNLAEHFGDVALSMEDIQRAAEHIVSSNSLIGVKEALGAFDNLGALSSTMENAIEGINKMNWKVSIGMELSEDEQAEYKVAIDEYVKAAQEYVVQSQYAVSLNLAVGFGDSTEGANIAAKVNQFYQDSYDEMTSLGQSMSDAVNEAFADGVLDPKEVDQIANLQAKIAEVEQSLATGEFDAKLSMLRLEYSGGTALTADSFMNLQNELNNQVAIASEAYKESYMKNYASNKAAHEAGALTDAEFETAVGLLEEEYLKNTGDVKFKAAQFMIDTIKQAYGDEIDLFLADLSETVSYWSSEEYSGQWQYSPGLMLDELVTDLYDEGSIDKSTALAIEQLMESMQPTVEQMEELKGQYRNLGIELSEEMVRSFADIDLLGAMTVRNGFFGKKGNIDAAYNTASSAAKDLLNSDSIGHRANGGLATRPELTWFAENGPEMAIPIDGSQNAISLWEQTGRLLGMSSALDGLDLGSSSGPSIEYSPTLQFYGEAPSKDDLTEALRISQDEFDSLMDRYFKNHGREAVG